MNRLTGGLVVVIFTLLLALTMLVCGEMKMRELETISLAITAAETGHLVMGTLHTSSAPQTVDRMIDVFPEGQRSLEGRKQGAG